jgi:Domain of unknown function (DUF5615)
MGAGVQISFLVDEHLPVRLLLPILTERGHQVTPVHLTSEDPAILTMAEDTSSVIVTADRRFLNELFRYPVGHRRCYRQAGVIQVPGVWSTTRLRITNYLPVIEAVYALRGGETDRRVAIDLSQREIRIREP